MSQPTPYTRQTDFSEDERANVGGRSTVRTDKLDAELDALGATANAAAQNLGLIQRDDGNLRDRVVTPESLSPSTALMIGSTGFRPRGVYALGQSYQIRDMVEVDSGVYVCIQAVPTATDFNTERAAGKWQAFSASNNQALTASGLPFGPVAGISATNTQAAIIEVHDLAAQAKETADEALAGAGGGSGSGSGSTAIPPFAVAALAAATSAANRVNAEVRDPTAPPKAPTPGLAAGVGQIEVSWVKASYTQGHGPGRVLVWAAEWPDTSTPPAFSTAKALGALLEIAERTAISWNPNKKVRVWIAFESFDAYQGPVSDPADVTTIPIPATALGQLQFDANSLAAGLETGALVNDPHFSGGATRWANFLVRYRGGTSGVPAGCPVEYAAQFKGRDCVDTRGYSVRAGDQLVLSIFAHNGTTGLQVGIVAYFEYADGRAITPASVTQTPPPNTWTRIDGPITVPSGAVRMRIGPHISQAHTGTQTCWFGYIRAIKVSEGDEIRQGSLTAINIAARSITTNELILGAVTDHAVATSSIMTFSVPAGASVVNEGASTFNKVRLPRQISRGLLIITAQFICTITSNQPANVQDLKWFEIGCLFRAFNGANSVAMGVAQETPLMNPYRGASAVNANSLTSKTFILYIDEPAKFDCDVAVGVVFRGYDSSGQPYVVYQTPSRSDSLSCSVIFDAIFVENKV